MNNKKANKPFGANPRPSDRRLSANLVPEFADRGCRVDNAFSNF
jgi:hypothetical protein